jgi:hypothetical protein
MTFPLLTEYPLCSAGWNAEGSVLKNWSHGPSRCVTRLNGRHLVRCCPDSRPPCPCCGSDSHNTRSVDFFLPSIEYSPMICGLERVADNSLKEKLVGTGRFELPTPRTPSECSTRLSHVPTAGYLSLIERLGLTSKFYTSPRCRVAKQVASIYVSVLVSVALALRQSQIESSFLPDRSDQLKPECAAPGDRFFGCAGR